MQDLRERLEEASVKVLDTSQGGGHEQMIPLDDAYRIAMEFAREEGYAVSEYFAFNIDGAAIEINSTDVRNFFDEL